MDQSMVHQALQHATNGPKAQRQDEEAVTGAHDVGSQMFVVLDVVFIS
jgi:hypothetical protein